MVLRCVVVGVWSGMLTRFGGVSTATAQIIVRGSRRPSISSHSTQPRITIHQHMLDILCFQSSYQCELSRVSLYANVEAVVPGSVMVSFALRPAFPYTKIYPKQDSVYEGEQIDPQDV
jgi:hypothetical protein